MSDASYEDYAGPGNRLPPNYDLTEESGVTTGPEDMGQAAADEPQPEQGFWEMKHFVLFGAVALALVVISFFIVSLETPIENQAGPVIATPPVDDHVPPTPELQTPAPRLEPRPSTGAGSSMQEMIQRAATGVVFIKANLSSLGLENGTGTGFVINEQGYVLTNQHVVDNADEYVVYFENGSMSQAQLVAADATLDVALLKVPETTPNRKLDLGDSDATQIGQQVFALGYPLGTALGQEMTVTDGIVSSIRANGGWFQISAAVNPGNSGGPLIRSNSGEVIGLITAKIKDADNIGFARPINACKEFIRQYTYF